MDNKTALWFATIIVLGIAADGVANDWQATLAAGRMVVRMSDWLAFWHNM